MTGHFEAKKHAYRQTQDGIVVSFVMHPNDIDAAFAVAPLGTRYMVAFAEIGDDEKALETPSLTPERPHVIAGNAGSIPASSPKDRRPFTSLPLVQQAAIRCQDHEFQAFMACPSLEDATKKVRLFCGVTSRSELMPHSKAGKEWLRLEAEYQAYLTTRRYADYMAAG